MSKSGKTITVFLLVISILLLCLTIITIFFFQKEREMRKFAEVKLQGAQENAIDLEANLKEAKKQAFLFEEKTKEAEERINGLMDDLELEKGLREEMKAENTSLKEMLEGQNESREVLFQDLIDAKEKIAALEKQLKESFEVPPSGQKEIFAENPAVTSEVPEGMVLSINRENNFIIFNLGKKDGIKEGMVLSVLRNAQRLGDVRVTRVQEDMSVADLVPPLTNSKVRKDDKVVVKE